MYKNLRIEANQYFDFDIPNFARTTEMTGVKGLSLLDYGSAVNAVYGMMNALLYDLERSSYYNYHPESKADGYDYYHRIIEEIRKKIDQYFLANQNVRKKLYGLLDEEEALINSCSMPGAPKRWMQCNPKLRYFDCVFDFIEENLEVYYKMKYENQFSDNQLCSFSFYPEEREIEARNRYFADAKAKCEAVNKEFSVDGLYQRELIETLRMLFEKEFSGENM